MRKYFIDENAIMTQIENNKKKPVKNLNSKTIEEMVKTKKL